MSANPGNDTSLVLKEEYKSFKVHNKHITISPACRICYCNLCRHNWIQHFIVFVYNTSIEFCKLYLDFNLFTIESCSYCTRSLLSTNQICLMHMFFITFIKINKQKLKNILYLVIICTPKIREYTFYKVEQFKAKVLECLFRIHRIFP